MKTLCIRVAVIAALLVLVRTSGGPALRAQDASDWLRVNVVKVVPERLEDYIELQLTEVTPGLQEAGVPWRSVWRTAEFGNSYELQFVQPVGDLADYDAGGPLARVMQPARLRRSGLIVFGDTPSRAKATPSSIAPNSESNQTTSRRQAARTYRKKKIGRAVVQLVRRFGCFRGGERPVALASGQRFSNVTSRSFVAPESCLVSISGCSGPHRRRGSSSRTTRASPSSLSRASSYARSASRPTALRLNSPESYSRCNGRCCDTIRN